MRRTMLKLLSRGVPAGFALALLATGPALAAHPFNVTLYDATGSPVSAANPEPYSPKQTCSGTPENGLGSCHGANSYDTITSGYHFQQGFDELIADADRTAGEKPFIKSPGMYGKW